MNKIDKYFHISERGSNFKSELRGGVTSFLTSLYLIILIPGILKNAGVNYYSTMTSVALVMGVSTILSGLISNTPFIIGPGIGFATTFTYSITQYYGCTWQQTLSLVFVSGILFLLISLSPLRERLTDALPPSFKFALSAGVGLLITLSGLINSGLIQADNNLLSMGSITSAGPLLALFGIFLTAVLKIKKVPCALIIGMLVMAVAGIPFGITTFPERITAPLNIAPSFWECDFSIFNTMGFVPILSALLSFVISGFFDATGVMIGIGTDAGLTDSTCNLEGGKEVLLSTSLGSSFGALMGVSSLTVLAESATGIKEGSRTGLSSVIAGLMFIIFSPFVPLTQIVSDVAMTAPLVMVGMSMMSGITQITWKHVEISLPCFLIIVGTPFTSSITTGLMLGVVSYVVVMVCRKRADLIDPTLYGLAAVFVSDFLLGTLV